MNRKNITLALVPIEGGTSVFTSQPVSASCCDGRMTVHFVSRDGVSRCVACDRKHTHQEHP